MRVGTLALAITAVSSVASAPIPDITRRASEVGDVTQSSAPLERRSPVVNPLTGAVDLAKQTDNIATELSTANSRFLTDGHPVSSTVLGRPSGQTYPTSYSSQPYHYGYSGYQHNGYAGQPYTYAQAPHYPSGTAQVHSQPPPYQPPDNRWWSQRVWDWAKANPIDAGIAGGIAVAAPIIGVGVALNREHKHDK